MPGCDLSGKCFLENESQGALRLLLIGAWPDARPASTKTAAGIYQDSGKLARIRDFADGADVAWPDVAWPDVACRTWPAGRGLDRYGAFAFFSKL